MLRTSEGKIKKKRKKKCWTKGLDTLHAQTHVEIDEWIRAFLLLLCMLFWGGKLLLIFFIYLKSLSLSACFVNSFQSAKGGAMQGSWMRACSMKQTSLTKWWMCSNYPLLIQHFFIIISPAGISFCISERSARSPRCWCARISTPPIFGNILRSFSNHFYLNGSIGDQRQWWKEQTWFMGAVSFTVSPTILTHIYKCIFIKAWVDFSP